MPTSPVHPATIAPTRITPKIAILGKVSLVARFFNSLLSINNFPMDFRGKLYTIGFNLSIGEQ